jgi:hypothetical protein
VANVRKAEFRKREEEKARWRVRLFMEDIILFFLITFYGRKREE